VKLLIPALLLLPTLALAAPARFAVLVGTNEAAQGTGPLYYAESDAERVADVLGELGGVPRENVILLRSPTRAQVEAALARMSDRIAAHRATGDHATLVFYYSGHAQPDAVQLGPRATLDYDELRTALQGTGADVRLLFFDSCYAGTATRTKGASRAPGFLEEATAEVTAKGEVVITSSASDEASQESDEIGGSYFTHYLLSGLRGAADESGDGEVTLEEAYRYVYHRTVAHTAATRAGAQHPGFDYDLQGSGDLVLTTLGHRGASLRFDAGEDGRFLVFDEDDQRFVAEVQVLPGRPTRLMVEAGRYLVQRRDRDALLEQRLALSAGDEGAVQLAAMERVPYAEDTTKGAVARVRRRASGREATVTARGGVQAFFDKETRDTLLPPTPLFGAEMELRGLIGRHGAIKVDVLAGGRPHEAVLHGTPATMEFFELTGGVGVFFSPRLPGAPSVRPFVGGRAAILWMHRTFGAPLIQAPQDYVMVAPGLAWGLGVAPDDRLRLSLEGRAHLMVYVDDGEQEALGYGEALFSIGSAF
jgi:hypothetical protein